MEEEIKEPRRLRVGEYNRLKIVKELDFGVYLDGFEDEILVPRQYLPDEVTIGDFMDVFIYRDSEDRLIGTTLEPLATVGDFAYLEVKQMTSVGAFMDWGLMKDLLVPITHQKPNMAEGVQQLVYVFLDKQTDRILASAKYEYYTDEDIKDLEEGQQVDILPFEETDLGIKAIINQRWVGVLYHAEIFKKVTFGKTMTGYIKKIRIDNLIDLALVPQNFDRIEDFKSQIINLLQQAGGTMPYHDKTDPQVLYDVFEMSKKDFKKAIGGLFKEQKILITRDGIQLV
jgi:uncharacterized protein